MKAPRGFTLLELAVAIAMSVIVVGTATSVLATVLIGNQRQRALSELARDSELVNQLLTQELRQAGLGVPAGQHIMENCDASGTCVPAYGTVAPAQFLARRLIVAAPTELGFLADIPRPDATYATFGTLHNRATGSVVNSLAWHTENNGTCVPDSAPDCDIAGASVFFPGNASACASGTPGVNDRTCPWGTRRVIANDALQIVDGNGNWSHTHAESPLEAVSDLAHNNILSLRVLPFDLGLINGDPNDTVWPNAVAGDGPGGFLGQGWVTSIDRVFYRLNGTRLERLQCFGDPDPDHPSWPPPSDNAVPASVVVSAPASNGAASSPTVCVGPEVVARNVAGVTFAYFDATGAALTSFPDGPSKNAVAEVRWSITLEVTASVGPVPVRVISSGSVRLQSS